MPYTPFDKNLADISPDDLATLTNVYEGWYVEYKSRLINNRALAKSLSSFANQYGGWLFLGIVEDGGSHAAKSFPGIPNCQVPSGLESLKNASKDLLRPFVFYETRVFSGPIESVGLQQGRSIIVVRIPEGPNTPYVHNDGRVYRRIADSSDPRPETDRATLDLLFQRGEQTRSRLEERMVRSPIVSQAEEDQPFIHFSIFSDPFEIMGHRYDKPFPIFSKIMKQPMLPFDNVFPTTEGYIARQVSDNDAYRRLFTWEFYRNCHSFVSLPLPVISAYETDVEVLDSESIWSIYSIGERFVSEFVNRKLHPARILDLNHLLVLSGAIITRHRNLVAQAGVDGPFYIKARLENVWRTTPFVDLPTYMEHILEFDFPVVQDDDIMIPDGPPTESFMNSINPETLSTERIVMSTGAEMVYLRELLNVAIPIFNALGIPAEVLARSGGDLFRIHELRNKAQKLQG